ncbi:hypothetical protein D7D25_00600 [Proteiniphilum sp. X52]|nr:hypothetical protein D7D25_00600 [Proteiniphilum sp. X52]
MTRELTADQTRNLTLAPSTVQISEVVVNGIFQKNRDAQSKIRLEKNYLGLLDIKKEPSRFETAPFMISV